ncbi:MarR family transcriptional regulator [Asanoa ishikariensis]|uniref:Sugar kinase of the NBD/HSP70 family, may contain an N-terminal HTH domain n=1 Tax=Asanoa ishikariensis TaxID=137265 RepID=A0A1H3NAR8_9ACTN|nr:ROK family transcriptional regulator [Asanoa ishikariensis]GIF68742.1 MarR family transcriptional regulator [Asanoa ishikariensis]SDY86031.1 Sugar kinase of the NBD/HSP70 family, may contain an N-terminal HTH domain [Asanoa ishikariensis]
MLNGSTGWPSLTPATRTAAVELLRHGPLSRSALARRLGLSAGSVTRLVTPLLAGGLVVPVGPGRDGGIGRPSTPLDVVAAGHRFAGVKLTASHGYAVLADLRSTVLAKVDGPLRGKSPAEVVASVADLVSRVAGDAPLAGVGVSLGGRAADHRIVTAAPYLGWAGPVDLGGLVTAATGAPTVVDNDVLALARATHWFGAARGADRFALVTVGVGIGYGLVVHDRLVDSDDAGVGLVAHLCLDPLGPLCARGHRGCAEAMLASGKIRDAVAVGRGGVSTYAECLDLASAGDPVAVRVVDDAGRALGRLVAMIANLTMVPTVVLSGDGVELASVASDALAAGLAADRDPAADPVRVEIHPGGFDEWARGAAVTAIQSYTTPRGSAMMHR